MRKISLFEKLFRRKVAENSVESNKIDILTDFYFPSVDTMKAISKNQKLTQDQIKDYISYIVQNFYLAEDDSDKLLNFIAEWTKYSTDSKRMQNRNDEAVKNIVLNLQEGKDINVVDALWLSKRIYVDSVHDGRKRLISKTNTDKLDIELERNNPTIGTETDIIKNRLRDRLLLKQVDKNL